MNIRKWWNAIKITAKEFTRSILHILVLCPALIAGAGIGFIVLGSTGAPVGAVLSLFLAIFIYGVYVNSYKC